MGTSCCAKPIATIIRVGDFEAGIVGLENVLHTVYVSGVDKEAELMEDLLEEVKGTGNYVSPSREHDYKRALLREYRAYVAVIEHETAERRKA